MEFSTAVRDALDDPAAGADFATPDQDHNSGR